MVSGPGTPGKGNDHGPDTPRLDHAFFAVTGPPAAGPRWFEQGAASARHIVSGEPRRAATALTLHADAVHVAGNAIATALLLPAIVQRLGVGCGLWLVLLGARAATSSPPWPTPAFDPDVSRPLLLDRSAGRRIKMSVSA
jgi:membrane associated rhomboid family serine protease